MDRRQYAGKDWAFCSTHDIDYDRKWRPGIYKREILDRVILNREKETTSTRFRRLLDVGFSLLETRDPYRLALERIRNHALLGHERVHTVVVAVSLERED